MSDADHLIEVLFITGQPGAGKTAVAKELSELLWKIREPHAVVDVDELCRGVLPTQTNDFNRSLALANLAAVWGNFHAAGVRRLILARIIQSPDDIAHFGSVIPGAHIFVCLLQAPESLIQHRIITREPGSARTFLLSATNAIGELLSSLDLPGIRIDNGQRPLNEVAREILERAQWPCPPIHICLPDGQN